MTMGSATMSDEELKQKVVQLLSGLTGAPTQTVLHCLIALWLQNREEEDEAGGWYRKCYDIFVAADPNYDRTDANLQWESVIAREESLPCNPLELLKSFQSYEAGSDVLAEYAEDTQWLVEDNGESSQEFTDAFVHYAEDTLEDDEVNSQEFTDAFVHYAEDTLEDDEVNSQEFTDGFAESIRTGSPEYARLKSKVHDCVRRIRGIPKEMVLTCLIQLWRKHGVEEGPTGGFFKTSYHTYCKKIGKFSYTPSNVDWQWNSTLERESNGYFSDENIRRSDPLHTLLSSVGYEGKTIEADETYSEPFVRPLPLDQRAIVLCSPCGTGKTNAAHQWLMELHQKWGADLHVVWVSHRIALSEDALQRLPQFPGQPWVMYNTIEGPLDLSKDKFQIVQYESLARVEWTGSHKQVFVLDEFNSICKQMESGAGDHEGAQYNFTALCQKADFVLAMDGHFDQDRLEIFNRYIDRSAYVIHNRFQHQSENKVHTTTDAAKTMDFIADLLDKGSKVHCPCFSKKDAETLYVLVGHRFGATKVALLYTSDKKWDSGQDVNQVWSTADIVIHTSTIDCGISFEVQGHFDWCCCLFSNSIQGLDFETGAQMMARSRDTKNFLLCVSSKSYHWQELSKEKILDSFQPREVREKNCMYFGTKVIMKTRMDTLDQCCPYLLNKVNNTRIANLTRQNFMQAIASLIERDGAQVTPMEFGAVEDLKAERGQAAEFVKSKSREVSIPHLCKVYNTPKEIFEHMDDRTLDRYRKPRTIHAFRNQCAIRAEGPDFPSAMDSIWRKQEHCAVALQAVRASKKFDPNLVTMAEFASGQRGNKFYDCNSITCEVLDLCTGCTDPFQFQGMYQSDIMDRLGCVGGVLSEQKKRRLFKHYEEWMELDPDLFTPFRAPKQSEPLKFITAITMLNHVLGTTFGFQLARSAHQKQRRGEKPNFLYVLELSDFQEQCQEPTRPLLPFWAVFPADVKDGEELQCHTKEKIIAVSSEYRCRKQTRDSEMEECGKERKYRKLKAEDIGCANKTKKKEGVWKKTKKGWKKTE